jgi:hypothetical protein
MKRTVIATMLLLGAVVSAQADAWTFKDVSRPHGSARDMAAKRADFRACGSPDGHSIDTADEPAFRACMRAHGWVLDHIVRDTAHTRRSQSQETSAEWKKYHPSVDWTDFLGPCGAPIC